MADTIPTPAITARTQIVAEATYATEIDTTYVIGGLNFSDQINLETQSFKAQGSKVTDIVVYGLENVKFNFDGWATYEDMDLLITSVPLLTNTDIPSFVVERGAATGRTYLGCVVDSWSLKGDRTGTKFSGTMFGASGAATAPTAALEFVPQSPVENGHFGADGIKIATVAVTNWFEYELSMSNLWEGVQYGGSAVLTNAIESDVQGKFTIKLEAHAANLALMGAAARVSGGQLLELHMIGTAPHVAILQCNILLTGIEPFYAQGQVYAYGLTFDLVNIEVAATNNLFDAVITIA